MRNYIVLGRKTNGKSILLEVNSKETKGDAMTSYFLCHLTFNFQFFFLTQGKNSVETNILKFLLT